METANIGVVHSNGETKLQIGLRDHPIIITYHAATDSVQFLDAATGEMLDLAIPLLNTMRLESTPASPILDTLAYFSTNDGRTLLSTTFTMGSIAVLPSVKTTGDFLVFGASQTVVDSGIQKSEVKALLDATTLAGFGIADAYTKSEIDGKLAGAFHFKGTYSSFSALTAAVSAGTITPSTGDTYNITNAGGTDASGTVIKAGDNVAYNGTGWDCLAGTIDLSSYVTTTSLNTTLASYVTTTLFNTELAKKANTATSLSGYGITNAYTKSEVDNMVSGKLHNVTVSTSAPTSSSSGSVGDLWAVVETA